MVKLSSKEIELLSSNSFFEILKKVDGNLNSLLYSVQQEILSYWKNNSQLILPEEASQVPGKISKGYNYKGFPYQVMDFPSVFGKQDTFSFRVFFWYGNYFSANLLLTGRYAKEWKQEILRLNSEETFLLLDADIWESDISDRNKLSLTSANKPEIESFFDENESIRLFRLFNMQKANQAEELIVNTFGEWFKPELA